MERATPATTALVAKLGAALAAMPSAARLHLQAALRAASYSGSNKRRRGSHPRMPKGAWERHNPAGSKLARHCERMSGRHMWGIALPQALVWLGFLGAITALIITGHVVAALWFCAAAALLPLV